MSAEVERYLSKLPLDRRRALHIVRETIRSVAPKADESMRGQMPTFNVDGDFLAALSSERHFMSLHVDEEVLAEHSGTLAHLQCGTSCVRFRRLEDLPLDVVKRMMKATLAKRQNGKSS
jgi:uncharacterized protein YdhG (YjbR/CyaY superfamily)